MKKWLFLALLLSGCSTLDTSVNEIRFKEGSYNLSKEAQAVIVNQMDYIDDETPLIIEGYGDYDGDTKLARLRAEEVREYLVMKGVDRDNITIYDFASLLDETITKQAIIYIEDVD